MRSARNATERKIPHLLSLRTAYFTLMRPCHDYCPCIRRHGAQSRAAARRTGHRSMITHGTPVDAQSPERSRDAAEKTDATQASLRARFRNRFREASYYSTGRDWDDYAPAYRYGEVACMRYLGKRFEEVEHALEQRWPVAKASSRLVWVEARGAVRDAWQAAREDGVAPQVIGPARN